MQALRRASLPLRNHGFGIRASLSNSARPNSSVQDKGGFVNSAAQASGVSANLFTVGRGLSSQAGANPWARENIPPVKSWGKIKEGGEESESPPGHVPTQKLIKKFVNFRMRGGKRTGVRAMMYQTFRRAAQSERDVMKLVDEAVENVKPVCKVEKVGVAGAIYDVPGLVSRHRQESLAIRWILDAASKRRVSNKITLEKCLFSELVDAHRKKGVARKKRESVHKLASDNRSFAHFRWW